MKCLCCQSEKLSSMTKPYFYAAGDNYIIIENVPCTLCESCGEVFCSTNVLERVEEIIEQIGQKISKVYIMDYNMAA